MKNIIIASGHAGTFTYFRVQPMGRRFCITADTVSGREVILGTFIEKSAAHLAVAFIMESEAALIDYQTLAHDAAECIASVQSADDEDDYVVSFPLPTAKNALPPHKEDLYDEHFLPSQRENG